MVTSHYSSMVREKKWTLLVFIFLFVFSPLTPVMADELPAVTSPEPASFKIQSAEASSTTATIPQSLSSFITPSTIKHLLPDTDTNTGALIYSYPIVIPPGRNGMQPDITLQYHNQQNEEASLFGYGWSVSIPSIERLNKKGSQELFNQGDFTSSLSEELSARTNTTYGAKSDDGEFLEYSPSDLQNGTVWTAYDKHGTMYTFGATSAERQDNPKDPTQVFKWMISEIRDRNDNFVSYSYEKSEGQIYPKLITYTGHGTTSGLFTVEFIREARGDVGKSYKGGFLVQTKERVRQIKVSVNNSWVRTYDLDYSPGQAGLRSLLTSITESGQSEEGNILTRPPTTFDYANQSSDSSKNIQATFGDTSWVSPVYTVNPGIVVADVNGDALPDILSSVMTYSTGTSCGLLLRDAYLNTGFGWVADSTWLPPVEMPFGTNCNQTHDEGIQAVDVNGDGLTDLVRNQSINTVFLNTGSGWKFDENYSNFSSQFTQPSGSIHQGMWLVDLNGDGLPDWIYGNSDTTSVQLNTGTGWGNQINNGVFDVPTPDSLSASLGVAFADVNTDGLIDLLRGGGFTQPSAWLNTGSGWVLDTSFTPPTGFIASTAGEDGGVRAFDMNNDGLTDMVRRSSFEAYTWLNTGSGWTEISSAWAPSGNCTFNTTNPSITDLNADGLTDWFCALGPNYPPTTYSTFNTGTYNDDLVHILYPTGGSTDITYKSSHAQSPKLPMVIQVVDSIIHHDGLGTTSSYTYAYEGGFYFSAGLFDRKFGGFHSITRKDASGNSLTTWYHQGNATDASLGEYDDHFSKIGQPFRVEVADSTGKILTTTVNKWEKNELPNLGKGSWFVKLTSSLQSDFDGNSTHRDRAVSYAYDNANGNLIGMDEWGEVNGNGDGTFTDTGADKRMTTISYTTNAWDHLNGLPILELVKDQTGAKVSETKSYYDLQPFGSVNKGNLTRQERWKDGSQYIDIERTYNSYGFLIKEFDPADKPTTYTPDSYNLYPAIVTNALNQSTQYVYDYSSGKSIQVTEPNGAITKTTYDAFDRPLEEKRSNPNNAAVLETKTAYVYVSETIGEQTKQTDFFSDGLSKTTYFYTDGFDRPIQARVSTETENLFSVTDTIYDNREYIQKQSLPYFSSGFARTTPTTTPALYTLFDYDALGRTTNITTSVGTTSSVYDEWATTVTDPAGKFKTFHKDAYDRLTAVVEHNLSSSYTTIYSYNGHGDLIKLTDALGNVRAFTYDGLSRRLSAQDLHTLTDTTFGTWTYTFDDAGNLITSLSPNGVTVTYGYDALNRMITEDASTLSGVEITNVYDSCMGGIGQLCKAEVKGGAITQYTYDAAGRKASEKVTITGAAYTTGYVYDRQGHVLTTIHPDGTQVRNTYNALGKLETIEKKSSPDSNFVFVVSNMDYGPDGQMILQTNANNTTTTFTYDENKQYRLKRKVTTGFETPNTNGTTSTTTTMNFYPTTGDGVVFKVNTSWDSAHDAASGSLASYTGTTVTIGTSKPSSSYYIYRGFLPFDTSSIPDDATITSTKLNLYVYNKKNNDNDGDDFVTVVQTSQASTTKLIADDFDQAGALNNPVEGIDVGERKDITDVVTNKYLGFTLNNTGRDWISKSGVTKLGLREGHDVIDSAFTSSSATTAQYNYLYFRTSEYSGASFDPYLEVTYTQPTASASEPTPIILQDLSYSYDPVGNITQIVDASKTKTAKTTDYVYDDLHRLTSAKVSGAVDANNGTITYAYNAIGNLTLRSDVGTYAYSGSDYTNPHAVTSIKKMDGTTVTYSYDKNGNLLSDGTTVYTWDYKNRLTSSSETTKTTSTTTTTSTATFYPTSGDGYVWKYSPYWDSVHDATSGAGANYTSTSMMLVGTAKSTTSYYIYRGFLPFDTSALPDDATVISATLSVYPYSKKNNDNDGDDWITVVQGSQASSTSLVSADFDSAGSINSPVEGVDTSERKDLTNIITGSYTTFTLNATGLGWTSLTGTTGLALREGHDVIDSSFTSASTISMQYNYLHLRPSEYSGTSYDPYLTVTYTQPTTTTATATTSYAYDHAMRRVSKTSDAGTTYYPSSDYSVTDSVSTVYVTGPSGLTASIENNGTTSTTSTIHTDHLGSTSVVTDKSGIMDELMDYHPYGTQRISWSSSSPSGTANTQKTYIGEYSDDETGLSYLNARYYDPERGQFLSQDPVYLSLGSRLDKREQLAFLDPQSQNGYLYARGNPLVMKDDTGEMAFLALAPYASSIMAGLTAFVSTPALQAQFVDGLATLRDHSSSGMAKAWAALGVATSMSVSSGGRAAEWGLGSFARGRAIENVFGSNLGWNFPVIDKFVNGVATSIKSLDLNAKSYQNMGTLSSKLRGYVDKVAGFVGKDYWAGDSVPLKAIQSRQLEIVIPKGSLTDGASKVFQEVTDYAKNIGVGFKSTEF